MEMESALKEAMELDGAIGVSLVDYESGMCLGSLGGGKHLDLEVASAGNTEVIRAKMRTMDALGLKDTIDDILITLGRQYHIIRIVQTKRGGLFLYLALDKNKANLALARHQLRQIEHELEV